MWPPKDCRELYAVAKQHTRSHLPLELLFSGTVYKTPSPQQLRYPPLEASWPQRHVHSAHTLHCRDIRKEPGTIKRQIQMGVGVGWGGVGWGAGGGWWGKNEIWWLNKFQARSRLVLKLSVEFEFLLKPLVTGASWCHEKSPTYCILCEGTLVTWSNNPPQTMF